MSHRGVDQLPSSVRSIRPLYSSRHGEGNEDPGERVRHHAVEDLAWDASAVMGPGVHSTTGREECGCVAVWALKAWSRLVLAGRADGSREPIDRRTMCWVWESWSQAGLPGREVATH